MIYHHFNFDHVITAILVVFQVILNEYTDHRKPEQTNLDLRDMTLEILSDSIVVAPVLQTAALHAKVRKNSFVYVFKQQTVDGYHPEVGRNASFVYAIRKLDLDTARRCVDGQKTILQPFW